MQKKNIQTPGTMLKVLLAKHGLNCNRLAKAINMSNAMVRLLVLDKSPVSIAAACRLGKFFRTEPEYWLSMQMKYDLSKARSDKTLAKEVNGIADISKYSFVRKPHGPRTEKEKAGKKKATLADKRKSAKKVPGAKPARGAKSK